MFFFRSGERCHYSPGHPGLPDLILAASLGQLDDTWLDLGCCRGMVYLPLRMASGMFGRHPHVGEVVPRLRCLHCRVAAGAGGPG